MKVVRGRFTTNGQAAPSYHTPSDGNCMPMMDEVAAVNMLMHGMALKLTLEDMGKMARQEGYNPDSDRGYGKAEVDIEAYGGRIFKADGE